MKGPTICRLPCGNARRTSNPSPRSRVRGTMTSSSASQDWGSPSMGSLEGCQLMSCPLVRDDHSSNQAAPSLRRGIPRPSDITRLVTEAFDHDRRQILGLVGDAAAGTHGVTVLMPDVGRRLSLL